MAASTAPRQAAWGPGYNGPFRSALRAQRSATRAHHRVPRDTAPVAPHAPNQPGRPGTASTKPRHRRTSRPGRRQAAEDRDNAALGVDLRWCRGGLSVRTTRAGLSTMLSLVLAVGVGSCTDRSAPTAPDTPKSTSQSSDDPRTPSGVTLPSAVPSASVHFYEMRSRAPSPPARCAPADGSSCDGDVGPQTEAATP